MANEQEAFWQGEFGNDYAARNRGDNLIAANTALFSKILNQTQRIDSILELGSNIGLNLIALRHLLPQADLSAVEINQIAIQKLANSMPDVELHQQPIVEFESDKKWDLVFTKGVLIHINPNQLKQTYELMVRHSSRYILVCEYYNPQPTEIVYRGETGKLFKRDFAGEILDSFPELSLIDYGFVYHRDRLFPQDDVTWFLLEKT